MLLAGLWAAFARHYSFTDSGSRWLLVSLILYLSSIPFIPLVFLPRGRVFEQALAEAKESGEVTPELSAAFHDRAVAFARNYELVMIVRDHRADGHQAVLSGGSGRACSIRGTVCGELRHGRWTDRGWDGYRLDGYKVVRGVRVSR